MKILFKHKTELTLLFTTVTNIGIYNSFHVHEYIIKQKSCGNFCFRSYSFAFFSNNSQ